MHLGQMIEALRARGNPVELRGLATFLFFFYRTVTVGWLWIEDGDDHWSVVWGKGADQKQARAGQVFRIDVRKDTGERWMPLFDGENRGVIHYEKDGSSGRLAVYMPESDAARVFAKISQLIVAMHDKKLHHFK